MLNECRRSMNAGRCACWRGRGLPKPARLHRRLGRTPWPRLKMCPRRPATRRRMSSAAASNRSRGPHSRTGSRFPWIRALSPIVCHASSMCWRQSTPITSPPASARSARIAEAPTPKWISGTPRSGRPSKMRCVWGSDELAIVVAPERAGPRVEDLERLGAGGDLRAHVRRSSNRRRARTADATRLARAYMNVLVRR